MRKGPNQRQYWQVVTVHVYMHSMEVTEEEVHMQQEQQLMKEWQQLQQILRLKTRVEVFRISGR